MMKYLVLIVALVATCGIVMADPSHPVGADLLKNVNRAAPVQDSLDIPNGGVATGAVLDTSVPASATLTTKAIYGASLPAGTNKIGVKCASSINYGTSAVTTVAASNQNIAAATMVYFRGSTSELEAINFTPATTSATVTVYIFPFQIK